MEKVITLDPITKKFTQLIPDVKVCYICFSNSFVDEHHYDLRYGKISEETVPLCRRCHKTIHMYRGIHMFDDDLLGRAIEVFNRTRVLLKRPIITRDEIKRSKYWLKKHGIKEVREDGSKIPIVSFGLPRGEPLCGWDWINEHLNDLKDYVPRIEVVGPNINFEKEVKSVKDLKEVCKTLRGLRSRNRRNGNSKKTIIYDPVMKRFIQREVIIK